MNHVAIKGNITRDIELRYLPTGTAVAEFSVAVNEVWYNDKKEKQERVHFIGCVAWGSLAENISKCFGKGKPILIEGSLSQDTWEDKETKAKREKTKVKVSGFDFCGGDKKASAPTPQPKPDPDLDAPDNDPIPF